MKVKEEAFKTHDIKKIMMGLCVNETQSPEIRLEVVMAEIPEELQREMEIEIRKFEKKAKDIVTTATERENKPISSTDNNFVVIPYEDKKRLVITTPTGNSLELDKTEAKILMEVIQDCIQTW